MHSARRTIIILMTSSCEGGRSQCDDFFNRVSRVKKGKAFFEL